MSDDKYTIQEMMAAIKKGLDDTRKEYPSSIDQLVRELGEVRKRANAWQRSYELKSEDWERAQKRIIELKEEIDKLKQTIADLINARDDLRNLIQKVLDES